MALRFASWLLSEETAQSDAVQHYLSQLEVHGYVMLAHQTSDAIADRIIRSQNFEGAGGGVVGTSDVSSSTSIRKMIDTMNKAHSLRSAGDYQGYYNTAAGSIHKGANAVLIMAIPNSAFGGRVGSLQRFNDRLSDLVMNGKLRSPGVPNNYIVGYWRADGQFFANGKFKPNGVLEAA